MFAHSRLLNLLLLLSLAALACRAGTPADPAATAIPVATGVAGTPAPGEATPTPPAAPTAAPARDEPPALLAAPSLPPVQFTDDPGLAVAAPIGPEGGTLAAVAADGTRWVLTVPAEALDFTETLTLTPASGVAALPLSGGMAGAVRIEPEGLVFFVPARLTIAPSAALSGDLAGFAYDGAGAEFHLRPLEAAGAAGALFRPAAELAQTVPVARGYGVGAVTADEAATLAVQPLVSAADVLEGRGVYSEYTESFTPAGAVHAQWRNSIEPQLIDLQSTVDPSPAAVDALALELDRWLAFINYWGLGDELSLEVANATEQIVVYGLAPVSQAAYERCVSEHRPEEAFRLVRWRRYALRYMPDSTLPDDAREWISKCLTFKLKFHSLITESSPGYGYYYEMGSELTLQATTSMRATGMGELEWIDLHWIGNDNCAVAMSGDGAELDLENDDLGLTISPVGRNSPAVNLTLRYYPGTPAEHTTMNCPGAKPIYWHTNGWELYFTQLHEAELTDTGYEVSSQIVGAGTFEGWIYNQTTSGPGGQDVVENSEFELLHTPQ